MLNPGAQTPKEYMHRQDAGAGHVPFPQEEGSPVIRLTRLNGSEMYLNADLVATVESHHDTVLTLVDGKTYVVRNTADEVVDAITAYRAAVIAAAEGLMQADVPDGEDEEQPEGRLLVLRPADSGRR